MSNVESTTDMLRNRVAEALLDGNGLPPTRAALDVIMAVVRATDRTDENNAKAMAGRSRGGCVSFEPSLTRYALNAESALRVLRKNNR
jgi:hypothetical protein